MATAEIKRHWDKVAQLGCIVTGSEPPTIHHCHGGSMLLVPGLKNPGGAQKQSDWLVIPLLADLHTGNLGIDTGMGKFKSVLAWELEYGMQVDHLDEVCRRLGYNVWEKAGIKREIL